MRQLGRQDVSAPLIDLDLALRAGATTAAGTLEVPAPVDHVTWTEQVAAFAQRDDLGTSPKTLIHTGRLSDATKAGFTSAGWTTTAVGYPGK